MVLNQIADLQVENKNCKSIRDLVCYISTINLLVKKIQFVLLQEKQQQTLKNTSYMIQPKKRNRIKAIYENQLSINDYKIE